MGNDTHTETVTQEVARDWADLLDLKRVFLEADYWMGELGVEVPGLAGRHAARREQELYKLVDRLDPAAGVARMYAREREELALAFGLQIGMYIQQQRTYADRVGDDPVDLAPSSWAKAWTAARDFVDRRPFHPSQAAARQDAA